MGYIGKPQSADPIEVNSSNITDGTIQAVDISSSFRESISGSFNASSASFSTRVTTAESELSNTLISSSAQIATTISGSFVAPSASFSSRTTTLEGTGTIQGVGQGNAVTFVTVDTGQGANELYDMNQNVKTDSNVTFGNITATGTVTAQEFHSEFVSASVIFTSGSTIFGDTSDDLHRMTGSLNVSGAINLNDGDLIVTDNVGIGNTSPETKVHITGLVDDPLTSGTTSYGTLTVETNGSQLAMGSYEASPWEFYLQASTASDLSSYRDLLLNPVGGRVAVKASSFPADFGSERGHFLISSTDNGSANNYAVLQLQGHSISNSVGTGGIYFYDHSNNTALIQVQRDSSTSTADMLFYTNGGSLTERMRIGSDGKVGIGTGSPAAHLEVVGGTDYAQIQLTDTDSDNTVQRTGILSQHYDSDEQAVRIIGMYNSDTTSNVQIGGGSGDHNSAKLIQFFTSANTTTTAGTLRMIIDKDGRVGIGTDNPSGSLHVQSANPTVYITNTTQDGASTLLRMTEKKEVDGDAGGYLLYNGSSNIFQIGTNISSTDTPSITLLRDGSGKVGIGTAAPSQPLHVYKSGDGIALIESTGHTQLTIKTTGTTDHTEINFGDADDDDRGAIRYTHSNEALQFDTNATERMRITTDGKVGIGTNNPASSLTVKSGAAGQAAGGIRLDNDGDTNPCIIMFEENTNPTSAMIRMYSNNEERLQLAASGSSFIKTGRLGIGTTSNAGSTNYKVPLHLKGSGDVDSFGYPQLVIESDMSQYPGIVFKGTEGTHGAIRIEGGDGFSFWTTNHSNASANWANRLRIAEDGTFTGSSSADISDRNLKKNINSISNGLEIIKQLQGRTFEWKESSSMSEGVKYGLIAQELEEVLPDLVYNKTGIVEKEDGTYYKSVFMGGVIPVLIEAVKELSAKVTALENA